MIKAKGTLSTSNEWVSHDTIEFRAKSNCTYEITMDKSVIVAKITGVEVRSKSLKIVDVNLDEIRIPMNGESVAIVSDWFLGKKTIKLN